VIVWIERGGARAIISQKNGFATENICGGRRRNFSHLAPAMSWKKGQERGKTRLFRAGKEGCPWSLRACLPGGAKKFRDKKENITQQQGKFRSLDKTGGEIPFRRGRTDTRTGPMVSAKTLEPTMGAISVPEKHTLPKKGRGSQEESTLTT